MVTRTSILRIRIDNKTKTQATQVLSAIGLTLPAAVRLMLHRIAVDQDFRLTLKMPNPETRAAIEESRAMLAKQTSRFTSANALFQSLEQFDCK